MPQLGLNDVEGADITFLDPILLAELLPARPSQVVAVLVRDNTCLPRRATAH